MGRLSEPSTYAGFAAIAQMFAAFFPEYAIAAHVITAAAGSAAMALTEKTGA